MKNFLKQSYAEIFLLVIVVAVVLINIFDPYQEVTGNVSLIVLLCGLYFVYWLSRMEYSHKGSNQMYNAFVNYYNMIDSLYSKNEKESEEDAIKED